MMGKSSRVLPVTNIHRAIQFYTQVLGLKLQQLTDDPAKRLTWAILVSAGKKCRCVLGLTQRWVGSERHVASGSGLMIPVEDIGFVQKHLKYFGGEILMSSPGRLVVKDPDGYILDLLQTQIMPVPQAA